MRERDFKNFFFFFYREAPLSCGVEKRRDQRNSRNFFDPASSQHHNSGGLHGKKNKAALSQLRALATRTPRGIPELRELEKAGHRYCVGTHAISVT